MSVCLSDSAGEVMQQLPPGPLPKGWFWLELFWPNGPSRAELIIPTLGDFADYEARKCARKGERLTRARLPSLSFDRYMRKRVALSMMEAGRLARGDPPYRVPQLTATVFCVMAEWAEDPDDTRRLRVAKTRLPLALDDLVDERRQSGQHRKRKPTISEKQLKAAKAAGASSVAVERNGCRVEARFGEPSGADVITGDRSEWDELLQ
jgi:hypothetical protein